MAGPPSDRGDQSPVGALAGAVHDATNSLTVLLGWLERAAQGDSAETRFALARAREHAQLVRQHMRGAIGARPIDTEEKVCAMSATQVLQTTHEDLSQEASQSSLQLNSEVPEGVGTPRVEDPLALGRVLTNLLLNALHASPEGSTITTRLFINDGTVTYQVQDAGPGIPTERREGLFHAGKTTREGGAGIGLKHAFEVTQDKGGSLGLIATAAPGACFELTWPTTPTDPSAARASKGRKPTKLDGLRMLMLEDDVAIQELLEISLPARGADLTTVQSLARMREALSGDAFDILLMDLSPVGDHLDQVLEELRSGHPGMGLIITSGSVTVALRDDVPWLRKPFTPDELAAAIRRERPKRTETKEQDPQDA